MRTGSATTVGGAHDERTNERTNERTVADLGVWLAFALGMAGCIGGCLELPADEVAGAVEAIVGGSDDVAADGNLRSIAQWRRDAVVMLMNGCSGTLVSPRIVATAYHCVNVSGQSRDVIFGADYFFDGPPLPPMDYAFFQATALGCNAFPGARVDGVPANCGDGGVDLHDDENDLAFIILDERVDHGPTRTARTWNFPALPDGHSDLRRPARRGRRLRG